MLPDWPPELGAVVDGVVVEGVVGVSVVAEGVVVAAGVVPVLELPPVLAAYAVVPPMRAPAIESIAMVFFMCVFMVSPPLCVSVCPCSEDPACRRSVR